MPREIQSSESALVVFLSYFVDLLGMKEEGCHFCLATPQKNKKANDNGKFQPFTDVSPITAWRFSISQIGALPIWCKH